MNGRKSINIDSWGTAFDNLERIHVKVAIAPLEQHSNYPPIKYLISILNRAVGLILPSVEVWYAGKNEYQENRYITLEKFKMPIDTYILLLIANNKLNYDVLKQYLVLLTGSYINNSSREYNELCLDTEAEITFVIKY